MDSTRRVVFGQFRFDATNECRWQGTRAISLRPKAFAVLKYLLERPGQLVTKQQLLDAVWADTYVGDAVLKDSIRQLRDVLGDDAATPQFIETAHRRGYRFIGQVAHESARDAPLVSDEDAFSSAPSTMGVLGREAELTRLRGWLERAYRGDSRSISGTDPVPRCSAG
jgi:DNA-binding winged helix-turn-helix (wHTH) protein